MKDDETAEECDSGEPPKKIILTFGDRSAIYLHDSCKGVYIPESMAPAGFPTEIDLRPWGEAK